MAKDYQLFLPLVPHEGPRDVERGGSCGGIRAGRDTELEKLVARKLRDIAMPDLAEQITVFWNPRLQTTAGLADWREMKIQLNTRLQGSDELERTLLHEAAHLVARVRSGRRRIQPHGPQWRKACADLGIPGEGATHHLPWPRRSIPPKLHYRCPNCHHTIPRVRPFRGIVACMSCCKRFAGGRFDERFRLKKIRLAP